MNRIDIDKNNINESAEKWGRHLDYLVWFVTSILLGANAILFSQYFSKIFGLGKLVIPIVGIILTLGNICFAHNFRRIKKEISYLYNKQIKNILGNKPGFITKKRIYQTYFFYPLHVAIITIWFFLLFNVDNIYLFLVGIILAIVISVIILSVSNLNKNSDSKRIDIKIDTFNKIEKITQGKENPGEYIERILIKEYESG